MSTPSKLSEQLPEIRNYLIQTLDKHAERSIYFNIGQLYRLEKNIRTIVATETITAEELDLLHLTLYIQNIESSASKLKTIDFEQVEKDGLKRAEKVCKKFELGDEILQKIKNIAKQTLPHRQPTLLEAKIYKDALLMEFAGVKGRDHLKQRYEEMILRDFELPKSNWYDTMIDLINNVQAVTEYGKKHIQPNVEKLGKTLKKERKDLENRKSLLLKKELNISEEEIHKLKKDITKAKGRDERGIQTLFRTTIKNHYTLNEMVDRKASIMITVNSIILSLVISGIIGEENTEITPTLLPILLLTLTSISSIIFAIIAIRPLKTQGNFSEEEIRNKQGNLLYFGNFFNMHFRDFEWGFLQMLNDKDYLYGSMIRDYYYQGLGLSRKYKFIRLSLSIFLFGFALAIFCHFLVRFISFS